ncbi:3'(2'),5'-bisphosphate nucleotidase CysQ [Mycobacterium botniense]|uniref:3'(2'),5'-bisphosphate nucleotidase CysQ n=1 Tax=Mycobacterium botniense TaxID=84962 RepID=A0A7I9Y3G5_9MYCO|nr:3'(2'),5'-bisphosphate nucleotidase CysQ [Mycobacterium botniense]GFG76527.1 3'(2'),5'-bisphosphate nucleotidase CysQ [Mycobacterium botniense]
MSPSRSEELLEEMVRIAGRAGSAIMNVYGSDDFAVELKSDHSPVTRADKAAHKIIAEELARISDYDIISEESDNRIPTTDPYWLIDPLDGTKEFIKRNGEFTVNLALVRGKRPILGVVYAPALNVCYCGNVKKGEAFKITGDKKAKIQALRPAGRPKVVVSRSHINDQTQALVESVGDHDEVAMGSSLKLCLVAEGAASLYPRLGPTSLWDTAAADAVVTAAGGHVTNVTTGQDLEYDPWRTVINDAFVVESADRKIPWKRPS